MAPRLRKSVSKRNRPRLENLESRTLFSGDVLSAALAGALTEDSPQFETDQTDNDLPGALTGAYQKAGARLELVFIDENTPDYKTLIQDLEQSPSDTKQIEFIVIGADDNGIELITETLSTYQNVDAVHLISHGSDGNVNLGNTSLNQATLHTYESEITQWGESFTNDGDFLIYGCDVAATDSGKQLSVNIAALAGVDVASSDDSTGGIQGQADWVLEQIVGDVETSLPFSAEVLNNYQSSLAASINVTTGDDVIDSPNMSTFAMLSANLGSDNEISMREAIIAANNQAGTDTIILPADLYKTELSGNGGDEGDYDITSNIIIQGAGAGSTIIENGASDRIFEVHAGAEFVLTGVTLMKGTNSGGGLNNSGTAIVTDVVFFDNDNGGNRGGAVWNEGSAVFNDSTFEKNKGNRGGGIYNTTTGTVEINNSDFFENIGSSAPGGAIANEGMVTITASTFDNNESNSGGAIHNEVGSTLDISTPTFTANKANNRGGAIESDGTLIVSDSTFQNNDGDNGGAVAVSAGTADFNNTDFDNNIANGAGGGVYSYSGTVTTHTSSTVQINTASGSGGGLRNHGDLTVVSSAIIDNETSGNGGGIFNNGGTASVTNSTFHGNEALSSNGGGFHNDSGNSTIRSSTFSDNYAKSKGGGVYERNGTVTIGSSIFSGNTTDDNKSGDDVDDVSASEGYNIITDTETGTFTPDQTDRIGIDPQLLPLSIYSGTTETHALAATSPAIDTGSPLSPAVDQRGVIPATRCPMSAHTKELLRHR